MTEETHQDLKDDILRLEDENFELRQEISSLEDRAAEEDARYEELLSSNVSLIDDYDDLVKEYNELKSNNDEQIVLVAEWKSDYEKFQTEVQTEVDKLHYTIENQQQQLNALMNNTLTNLVHL